MWIESWSVAGHSDDSDYVPPEEEDLREDDDLPEEETEEKSKSRRRNADTLLNSTRNRHRDDGDAKVDFIIILIAFSIVSQLI